MSNQFMECPYCHALREKDQACNYVTCENNEQNYKIECNKPWCWVCGLPKYAANKIEGIGYCNNPGHNSH